MWLHRHPQRNLTRKVCYFFWSLAGPYPGVISIRKQVKDRHARTPNVVFVNIKTHYKPTETFQYTHFTSCHPPGVKRGFIIKKAKRQDCLEQTLKKHIWMIALRTLNNASKPAGILKKI